MNRQVFIRVGLEDPSITIAFKSKSNGQTGTICECSRAAGFGWVAAKLENKWYFSYENVYSPEAIDLVLH